MRINNQRKNFPTEEVDSCLDDCSSASTTQATDLPSSHLKVINQYQILFLTINHIDLTGIVVLDYLKNILHIYQYIMVDPDIYFQSNHLRKCMMDYHLLFYKLHHSHNIQYKHYHVQHIPINIIEHKKDNNSMSFCINKFRLHTSH